MLQKIRTVVQLAPPYSHRENAAEQDKGTFKNHFVVKLASVAYKILNILWCWILKQADNSMNLLKTSGKNPMLSSYAKISGTFDFNARPMAPPGKKYFT